VHDLLSGQGILGQTGFNYEPVHVFGELEKGGSRSIHGHTKVSFWEP
jgi:hypothetical protein